MKYTLKLEKLFLSQKFSMSVNWHLFPSGDLILNCSSYKSLAQGLKKNVVYLVHEPKCGVSVNEYSCTPESKSTSEIYYSSIFNLCFDTFWTGQAHLPIRRISVPPTTPCLTRGYRAWSRTGQVINKGCPQISSAIANLKICGLDKFLILADLPQMWQLADFRFAD